MAITSPETTPDVTGGEITVSELKPNGTTLEEKLSQLMSGQSTNSTGLASSRPESAASERFAVIGDHQILIDRLQSRLEALEFENERLRSSAGASKHDDQKLISRIEDEKQQTASRMLLLEAELKTAQRSLNERDTKIQSLERAVQQGVAELEKQKHESECCLKNLQSNLDDNATLMQSLRDAIEVKEGVVHENDAVLKAKNAEVALLESRVERAYGELADERKELGSQVDELRQAGQVWASCNFMCGLLLTSSSGNDRSLRGTSECS